MLKNKKFVAALLLFLIGTSLSLNAETWSDDNYQEMTQPSMQLAIESINAHQRQWYNFHVYTMNLDVPGFLEQGGYNISKDGHIRMEHFLRRRGGVPQESNNPMDFAFDIDWAFFCVRMPDGRIGYTRDGRFRVDANRRLITLSGRLSVLNENNQEIFIPEGDEIAVSRSGVIFVNNNPVDKFKVVLFEDDDTLALDVENYNGTILVDVPGKTPRFRESSDYAVLQGYLSMNAVLKALNGDGLLWKYGNEASAKAARSQIKVLTSAVQMANP